MEKNKMKKESIEPITFGVRKSNAVTLSAIRPLIIIGSLNWID
jgi:hypothetical protein